MKLCQTCSETITNVQQNKSSSKHSQTKTPVVQTQGQPSFGGVTRNTKLQKPKEGRIISVPKQESERRPSAALSTRKIKDITENSQSVNKDDSDKDEPKKQNRKKNKKSVDITQKHSHALLGRKIEDTEKRSENIAREANNKKEPSDQKVVSLSRSGSDKEKQELLHGKIVSKTGSEISRSKKRRIRKRRLLESLGINIINSVKSAKEKNTTRKRKKKKKSEYVADSDTVRENCTAVKSVDLEVTSRSEGTSCDVVSKKGAVKKSKDIVIEESECTAVKLASGEVTSRSAETSSDTEGKIAAVKNCEGIITEEPLHKDCTALKSVNREVTVRSEEISFHEIRKKGAERESEDIVIEESDYTVVKSVDWEVTKRREETNCGIVGKKGAVRKSEDTIIEKSDCAGVKLVSGEVADRSEETSCDIVGKRRTISNSEDAVSVVPKLEDFHPTGPPEQVTEVKESKLEKNIFADTLPQVKEGNISLNSGAAVNVCASSEELQCDKELSSSGCKVASEDISHQFFSKKEEPSTSGRVDLVSLLYHDNIEALFRSALLNDVTLSSRCSEKEVKNFFNTYGTFSERGRSQFAAVEKLLHSSGKGGEDIPTSEYFEPGLNKDIPSDVTPQNSVTISNKEPNLDSSTSALTLVGSPKCEHFALKDIKDNVDADELGTASCVQNLENCSAYNQVVKGLKHTDSVGNSLAFRGGFSRGPIYTSPNPENRVTDSTKSSQILNSAPTVFVSDIYESCDVPIVQRLDSDLVDNENDLSVKQQFTSGDKTQLSDVCNVSEQSLACSVSPRLKDSHEEQTLDKTRTAEVNSAECQVNFIYKSDVIECRATEEEIVTESRPSAYTECPKEQKPIRTGLNNSIFNIEEKEDSENCPEKIQRNVNVEKYRWTGFVSECAEDIQETGFQATKIVEGTVSLRSVEESQGPDFCYRNSPAEVSYPDSKGNTWNESSSSDLCTDSNSKEPCVTEVSDSEIIKFVLIPSSENKVTMNHPQRKPLESSRIGSLERCREEVLAAREAKKAEKLARNKNKVMPSSNVSSPENVVVSKSQTVPSPSKVRQQPKLTTEAGRHETESVAKVESVSNNTIWGAGVKQLHSPVGDSSYQTSKIENKTPTKKKELKKKTDELQESENRVLTGSTKQDEVSRTTEILEEKMKDTGRGPQSLAVVPAPKSKAELRTERRAKQEKQRALKAAQQCDKVSKARSTAVVPAVISKEKQPAKDVDDVCKKAVKTVQVTKPKTSEHRVKLFNHLYLERGPLAITENLMLHGPSLHPAVVKLGMQYADRVVVGSNARCIALLDALKQVIKDYETPPQKEFSRGLEAELQPSVAFLDCCRPLSVSMTNALRFLMWQLTQLPNSVSDSEAKKKLLEAIDTYIREQIEVAAQAICIMVQRKIANGDVILTYGCSSLLQRILLEAHCSGTKFRVIVVDGRPWREGQEMLRRLVQCGLDCSYVLVSAASFIMREVTKVFLGAHALLANGYVMSRAGSSQVALLAHSYNVPVLVCCETHKFCERVQTDSFVYNELGNPDDLIPTDSCSKEWPLSKWRSIGSLTPLNLTYDVTPPDLVTAVVTELAILPCTSVPVILRIKPTETGC